MLVQRARHDSRIQLILKVLVPKILQMSPFSETRFLVYDFSSLIFEISENL